MSQADPNVIVQRSAEHLFVPTMDYEIGNGIYNVNRNRTIFPTSAVPLPAENSPCAPGNVGCYIVWYGAADAVVAWAFVEVNHQ